MNEPSTSIYDVIIVGASTAGCSAAILYAQQGLSVALVEKQSKLDAYKKICTHYIQSSCMDTLARMGVKDKLEQEADAVPTTIRIWTRWGWIYGANPETDSGYNIRRMTLDPVLRETAINLSHVKYFPATKFTKLIYKDEKVIGIAARSEKEKELHLLGQLVVGADGRNSAVALDANIKTHEWENNRFSCFAIYRNLPNENRQCSRMWLLDPEVAYQFPNDHNTTLIALMPTMEKLPVFKQDREKCYLDFIAKLPSAPDLTGAERISDILLNVKNSNLLRGKTPDGLALIGDAVMVSDPLHGLGIAWAILSAQWLVDSTKHALLEAEELRASLAHYRRKRWYETRAHLKIITDLSVAAPLNPMQRLLFSAAARDKKVAKIVNDFLAADVGVNKFIGIPNMVRSLWVNTKYALNPKLNVATQLETMDFEK